MAELKTRANDASVEAFLEAVPNAQRQSDAREVVAMMAEASGEEARMWGSSIIGFGSYDYKYATGREGTFMRIGLSPRKAELVLYLMPGYDDLGELLGRLGKHKIGKSCLYLKKLDDVDRGVLRELIDLSLARMGELYPT